MKKAESVLAGAVLYGKLAQVEAEGVRPDMFSTDAGVVLNVALCLKAAGFTPDFDSIYGELPPELDGLPVDEAVRKFVEAYAADARDLASFAEEVREASARKVSLSVEAMVRRLAEEWRPYYLKGGAR